MTKLLIGRGTDVKVLTVLGRSPLQSVFAEWQGVWGQKNDRPQVLSCLIENGAGVNFQGLDNDPPILFAVAAGNLNSVKALVRAGTDVDVRSLQGRLTLRQIAIAFGHLGIVDFFALKGYFTTQT